MILIFGCIIELRLMVLLWICLLKGVFNIVCLRLILVLIIEVFKCLMLVVVCVYLFLCWLSCFVVLKFLVFKDLDCLICFFKNVKLVLVDLRLVCVCNRVVW